MRSLIQLKTLLIIYFCLLSGGLSAVAQITSTTTQQLSFGSFYPGNGGGTICISPEGTRTVTGDVIAMQQYNVNDRPAIIEVQAPVGSRITILNTNTQLKGSNGGNMVLHISSPGTLITDANKTDVNIGGTLTVGSAMANPPGKYSGSFYITFMIE
jgi:hypothetical protein